MTYSVGGALVYDDVTETSSDHHMKIYHYIKTSQAIKTRHASVLMLFIAVESYLYTVCYAVFWCFGSAIPKVCFYLFIATAPCDSLH